MRSRRMWAGFLTTVLAVTGATLATGGLAGATVVNDEASFRAAYADAAETSIVLAADITLTCDGGGSGIDTAERLSGTPITIDGQGHTISQTCPDRTVLLAALGGGLTLERVTLSGGRGGVQGTGTVVARDTRITGMTSPTTDVIGISSTGPLTLTDVEIDDLTSTGGIAGGAVGFPVVATRLRAHDFGASAGAAYGVASVAGATVTDSSFARLQGVAALGVWTLVSSSTVSGTTIADLAGSADAYGILAAANTTVTDSSFTGISAPVAGGVLVGGNANVTRSTVADVTGGGTTGGITAEGSATVVNSTVTGVTGWAVAAGVDLTLVYSTVTGNGQVPDLGACAVASCGLAVGASGAAPLAVDSDAQLLALGVLEAFGSVVAQNLVGGPNCVVGSTASTGYNLADDTSCGLTGTGDRQVVGIDPRLGVLGANGGLGPTRIPLADSPLLDAIPAAACQSGPAAGIVTDERGLPRPALGGCDIGAVEVQPEPPAPLPEPRFTG